MVQHRDTDLPLELEISGIKIQSVLGRGGFGITYLGTRIATGEQVVLKENLPGSCAYRLPNTIKILPKPDAPPSGRGSFAWATENFIAEARTIASLRHPAIVPIIEAFSMESTATAYYTMPYIGKDSLEHHIFSKISVSKEQVLYLLCALMEGLEYVHSKKLLHRDIKPANVLIAPDGRPVLIDFGSAREIARDDKTKIMTMNYAPLEQYRGEPEGPWTDIYSLAASIVTLITGQGMPSSLSRVGKKDALEPLTQRPQLVEKYGVVLLTSLTKSLALEAEDRYQSIAEWRADLQGQPEFQSRSPIAFLPPQQMENTTTTIASAGVTKPIVIKKNNRADRSKKLFLILLILLLLASMAAAAFVIWQQGDVKKTPTEDLVINNDTEDDTVPPPSPPPPSPPPPSPLPPPPLPPLPKAIDYRLLTRAHAVLYQESTGDALVDGDSLLIFTPLFPVKKEHGRYLVSRDRKGKEVGWISEDHSLRWRNNLSMRFRSLKQGMKQRDRAPFFKDQQSVVNYLKESKPFISQFGKFLRGEELTEDAKKALKPYGVLALESPYGGAKRDFYLMPILDYYRDEKGYAKKVQAQSNGRSRSYNVVEVASVALPSHAKETPIASGRDGESEPDPEPKRKELGFDIVFLIDSTKSMGPFIERVKSQILTHVKDMEKSLRANQQAGTKITIRYGLCLYRDWRFEKKNPKSGRGEIIDQYVVKNYTPSDRFMTYDEFAEKLSSRGADAVKASQVDSLDYAEEVVGGLSAVINDMPWQVSDETRHNARWLFLIGDAPGREKDEQESDKLNNGNKKLRARGNMEDLNLETVISSLNDKHIKCKTFFYGLDYSELSLGERRAIKESDWKAYQYKAQNYFSRVAYGIDHAQGTSYTHALEADQSLPNEMSADEFKDFLFSCYIKSITDSLIKFQSDIDSELENARLRSEQRKREADKDATAQLKGRALVEQMGKKLAEETTAQMDALFSEAYVEWLSNDEDNKQIQSVQHSESSDTPNAPAESPATPQDTKLWLAGETSSGESVIQPGVLMSRGELRLLVSYLKNWIEQYNNIDAEYDPFADQDNSSTESQHKNLAGVSLAIQAGQSQEDVLAKHGELRDDLVKKLPYKSQTLVLAKNLVESDMNMLVNRVEDLIDILEKKLHESYDTEWFQRPGTGNDNDLIFISLYHLP